MSKTIQSKNVNKILEDNSSARGAQLDTETRFKNLAVQGDVAEGLRILDKLDAHFKAQQ